MLYEDGFLEGDIGREWEGSIASGKLGWIVKVKNIFTKHKSEREFRDCIR